VEDGGGGGDRGIPRYGGWVHNNQQPCLSVKGGLMVVVRIGGCGGYRGTGAGCTRNSSPVEPQQGRLGGGGGGAQGYRDVWTGSKQEPATQLSLNGGLGVVVVGIGGYEG